MRAAFWVPELLFPSKCILCRRLLEKGQLDLCPACRADHTEDVKLTEKIPFVSGVCAVWYYQGCARESILRYKFRGRQHSANAYGRLLAMKLLREGKPYDVITWVPISRRRKLTRGYDQVELLAKTLCRELDTAPTRCLKKIRHNPAQSGIKGYAQRKANVLGAYKAVQPGQFAGKRVLLLDDIITTGATLSECARVLLTAGAKEVSCAVIAAAKHDK